MFRLLLKIAIAVLVANALWHVGSEYLAFYRFKDDVRNAATYRRGSDDDLRRTIEMLAGQFDIPIDGDRVKISSSPDPAPDHTTIDLSYIKPIEIVPGFEYPWNFSLMLETVSGKPF